MEVSSDYRGHCQASVIHRDGARERFIGMQRQEPDEPSIFEDSCPSSGSVVAQMIFGGSRFLGRPHMNGTAWPMLWIQEDDNPDNRISGRP
jgi:hypothetical protein